MDDLERKIRDRQIKVLEEEIEAAQRQWESAISDEHRLILQRRIDQKLELLKKIRELTSGTNPTSNLNQQKKYRSEVVTQKQSGYEQLDTYFKGREFFQQGLSKQNDGDNDGAIEEYSRAVQIEPDLAEAYYNRAISKKLLEDDVGALKDYSKAIAILPELAEMFISQPNVYINLEEKYKGILYFDHKNHEYLVDAYNNSLIERIERISNNFNP